MTKLETFETVLHGLLNYAPKRLITSALTNTRGEHCAVGVVAPTIVDTDRIFGQGEEFYKSGARYIESENDNFHFGEDGDFTNHRRYTYMVEWLQKQIAAMKAELSTPLDEMPNGVKETVAA